MRPILIGGVGRSGTTILKNTLANHSQIMGLGTEMRWLADPRGLFHLMSQMEYSFSPPIVDRAWKEFVSVLTDDETRSKYLGVFGEEYGMKMIGKLSRSFFDTHEPGSRYHGYLSGPFHEAFYPQTRFAMNLAVNRWIDELMNHRAQEFKLKNQEYWIDDTPENVWWFSFAPHIFPDGYFIHCVRHPYDIVASIWRRQQGANVPWWWPVEPEDIAKRIHNTFRARWGFDTFCIQMELFIESPKEVTTLLLQRFGLTYEDRMTRYVLPEQAHTGRWREELSPAIVDKIRPILRPVLRGWGYDDC